jgi:hypothetical protein
MNSIWKLWLSATLLIFMDTILTIGNIAKFGMEAELNPIMYNFILNYGFVGFIIFKAMIPLSFCPIIWYICKKAMINSKVGKISRLYYSGLIVVFAILITVYSIIVFAGIAKILGF